MLGHEPWTFDRTVRLALVAAVIWGAVRLLGALSDAIIPFLMGLLFAYVLDPVVRRVEVRVRSRQAAIAVVLLGAVV
ncbi:MAG TPA: AI-2E family transporter, partial [Desulfomicrobiaceae bacterium]|nr:AI-2E family transporter [Desulfomicrobiaceae bacterium]